MKHGELTAVELVTACLAQIDRVDPVVNAMVIRNDELALERATQADEARQRAAELDQNTKAIQPASGGYSARLFPLKTCYATKIIPSQRLLKYWKALLLCTLQLACNAYSTKTRLSSA